MATRRSARLTAASATDSTTHPSPSPAPAPISKSRKRKAAASDASNQGVSNGSLEEGNEEVGENQAAPATPPRKSRARKPAKSLPATPTPSNVQLISEPANVNTHQTPKPKPAAVRKLADPNATNATLLSPGSSRIVARNVSPSKAKATTGNILEEACRHLIDVDERMKPLIEKHHCRVFSPEGLSEQVDPFESLCSGIISQQVSGAAAKAIKQRFVDLFEENKGKFPSPAQVAACTIERLRTAGLSQRKAEYVQGLAEKFKSGELSTQLLADAPYDVVLEKLIAVRGLGQWSVEMFACFGLKRMDVFSLGDLGVQRGMAAFVGRDVAKLKNKGGKWKYMSEAEMKEISEKFAPYRSVFMWYMWRVEETDISTME
ncbi:DNA glycosylase [Hypoxylon sp. FL1150]|nr:DNA glycosylase [Hypoxylon sp. FL1150]